MTKLTYNPNFTPLSGLTCGDFFHGKLTNIDEPTVYLKNLGNDKHELISLYGDDKKTYFVGHGRFPCFKAIDVEFEPRVGHHTGVGHARLGAEPALRPSLGDGSGAGELAALSFSECVVSSRAQPRACLRGL